MQAQDVDEVLGPVEIMKVSVITCSWNSEPYIAECIASVQAQSHADIEMVFVDGGSTDGTLERIQQLDDPRVKYVTGLRGGIARAMNAGVELADGDVIAHLHSDDYYLHPDVVARAVAVLEKSGAQWMFGNILSDIGGEKVANVWAMPTYSRRRLIQGNFIGHPAVFMNRRLFQQAGGFDPALKYAMDYDFWLRASALAEPVYLPEELAAFRIHPGSTTYANRLASFEEDHSVRLTYVSNNPVERMIHAARYWVRRRRLLRELSLREGS